MEHIELLELKDITTRLFGGYDKKSVKKYITRIIAENDEAVSAANKKADELEKKNEVLAQENESINSELRRYKEKTEQATKSLMDQISLQMDQIMKLSEQVTKHHQSEIEYQRKIEEIAQATLLIEKHREDAERESEQIISGARLAAQVELEKGKRESDAILSDARKAREYAERESNRMIEEAMQKRQTLLGSFDQAMNRFHELYDQVGHILEQEQKGNDENSPGHPPMRVL